MITTALVLFVLAQQQDNQQQPVQATPIIKKMIDRYAAAKTLTGTIRLTQSAGNSSGTLDTQIQFEKPSKLYVRQTLNTASKQIWLITSDGKNFTFNNPNNTAGDDRLRLIEPVFNKKNNVTHDVQMIYGVARQCLGDRSLPLDLAIARKEDVVAISGQLAAYRHEGKVKLRDEEVHGISGSWRENALLDAKGYFEMYISEAGDLRRFMLRQTIAPQPGAQPMQITSVWDVNLTVDGTPNAELFKVVR